MKAQIFTLLILLSSNSFADYYQAPMQEANWQVDRTKNTCFLRQAISQYGVAEFVQRAGQPLRFSVQEQRRKPLVMQASLKAMPAPWMHDQTSSFDHQVFSDSSTDLAAYGRLSVYGPAAETMIDALLQGQYPTFIYHRDAPLLNMQETRVAVSAIHFSERYPEFADCRNNLQMGQAISQPVSAKTKKIFKSKKKASQHKPAPAAANTNGQSAATNQPVKPS